MKRWRKRFTAGVACLMLLAGSVSVLAAVQGGQDNPLVTLSYLKDVFSKTVLQETDQKLTASRAEFEKKLDSKVTTYSEEMKKLSGSSGGAAGGAAFSVVDLSAGQALVGGIGCELMLRVGTAQCQSADSPGLIDSTSGGILENGKSLEKNHLYMMTIDGRSVRAGGDAVKLLVRGTYSIK